MYLENHIFSREGYIYCEYGCEKCLCRIAVKYHKELLPDVICECETPMRERKEQTQDSTRYACRSCGREIEMKREEQKKSKKK